jgi:hypothetical protein
MSIILKILAVIFLAFLLNVFIRQSFNLFFFLLQKPIYWFLFMVGLSFVYFFIGSKFSGSFNIIWWSAFLAFLVNVPPKRKKDDQMNKEEKEELIEEMYNEMGIKRGKPKYRVGLFLYVFGGILGWFIFYGPMF